MSGPDSVQPGGLPPIPGIKTNFKGSQPTADIPAESGVDEFGGTAPAASNPAPTPLASSVPTSPPAPEVRASVVNSFNLSKGATKLLLDAVNNKYPLT